MAVQFSLNSVDLVDQMCIFSARINAVPGFRSQLYTRGKNLIKDVFWGLSTSCFNALLQMLDSFFKSVCMGA